MWIEQILIGHLRRNKMRFFFTKCDTPPHPLSFQTWSWIMGLKFLLPASLHPRVKRDLWIMTVMTHWSLFCSALPPQNSQGICYHVKLKSWLPAWSIVMETLVATYNVDPSGEIVVLTKLCPANWNYFRFSQQFVHWVIQIISIQLLYAQKL